MKALILKTKDKQYHYCNLEHGFELDLDSNCWFFLYVPMDRDMNNTKSQILLYSQTEVEKFCEDSTLKLLISTFIEVLNQNLEEKTVFFLDDLKKQVVEKLTIKH